MQVNNLMSMIEENKIANWTMLYCFFLLFGAVLYKCGKVRAPLCRLCRNLLGPLPMVSINLRLHVTTHDSYTSKLYIIITN